MLDTPNATTSLVQIIQQRPELQTQSKILQIFKEIAEYRSAFDDNIKATDQNTALVGLLTHVDELMVKELERGKVQISCRKGCAHCCKQKVDMSSAEAKLIVDFCKEENIPIDTDYLTEQAKLTEDNWIANKYAPCTFLGPDNACTIYEVRPMACRRYVVMTPAEQCDTIKYPKGKVGAFGSLNVEIAASMLCNIDPKAGTLPQRILVELDKQKQ